MKPLMAPSAANAIVSAMFRWLYDEPLTNPERQRMQLSTIANVVIDATHADITCQPLHDAYALAKQTRGIV